MRTEEHSLSLLEQVAIERGDERTTAEVREAKAALAAGRFNVAFVGQFKRGKSTLINALLGRDLLPADVTPITSAITLVEFGPEEGALVRFENGSERQIAIADIGCFASEEENPGNQKGVRAVVVELPAPLLATGMRLVDTPGVGSVFELNSEVTRRFIPRIDVAVVVLGSDPPISGEELALVRAVTPLAGHMCYVLNKADRVRDVTRLKAEAFTRQVLQEALGRDPGPMIHACARDALREGCDPGVSALATDLRRLADSSGRKLARASAERAVMHIATRLTQQIAIERAALLTPLEDLERRISRFESAVRDIGDLALAACTRFRNGLRYDWKLWQEQRAEFEARQAEEIGVVVREELRGRTSESRRTLREVACQKTLSETRASVERWLATAVCDFGKHRDAHVERARSETARLIERVAEAAAAAFDIPLAHFRPKPIEVDLRQIEFEFFQPVMALDLSHLVVAVVDSVLPKRLVVGRAVARSREVACDWLLRNLYEVDRHLTDWLDAMSRQLESEMHGRLDGMRSDVLEAIETGRRRRQAGEEAIREELETIGRLDRTVRQAQESLTADRGDGPARDQRSTQPGA